MKKAGPLARPAPIILIRPQKPKFTPTLML